MKADPSATDSNGDDNRNEKGQFVAGNTCAVGNPHAKRVGEIRSLLLNTITDGDLVGIIEALIRRAKSGDTAAAHELLNRCLGKARQALEIDAIVEQNPILPANFLQYLDWAAEQREGKPK